MVKARKPKTKAKPAPKKKKKKTAAKAKPAPKKAAKPARPATKATAKAVSFKGLSPVETLRLLAQQYAAARANLEPDATDRERAVYAVTLAPPARDPDLVSAERASGTTFPADYRALLASLDGARFAFDLTVLGTADRINSSETINKGRSFVKDSISSGANELVGCLPIANLGQPNDWLLWDPGKQRYQYCLNADFVEMADLATALTRRATLAADVLAGE